MANLLTPVANLHSAHVLLTLRIWGREFTLVISPVGDISPCLCVCAWAWSVYVWVECVCVCVCVCVRVCVCVCVCGVGMCAWSVYV